MYAGSVICLGGLIFAGIHMITGRFQDAIPGLFGSGGSGLGGDGWIGNPNAQLKVLIVHQFAQCKG